MVGEEMEDETTETTTGAGNVAVAVMGGGMEGERGFGIEEVEEEEGGGMIVIIEGQEEGEEVEEEV